MDRWRAAGALLALAACIASSVAAPTSTNDNTALDLANEHTDGCYYNFQHYGEGDRIMTNEPCLNCTCHNRMLMCYLRVCPFTKAIGQDCTVEKRADQCCPIVTCPDVPVDLLTSTSTTSPAEYGGTGVGKVDNYGCTINGRYFPEGSKVPQTPGKPCEHCYCIRNMTTCVMQECTLHVDGCTPIYHKDVCCPVRYFCDHPEDEMPLLDDMTTTVRPTPGFLLTTTEAPATEAATTTLPPRRDCIEGDQLYPDGALIKTEKPCEHCYCMKGDIVCVVQECGTPMENEGKNCTSLAPREGQCCPDTYICEGDEVSTEPATTAPFEELSTVTPPRRVNVEGSGYRNEDEIPYTEAPTFATELEGSGEEEPEQKPLDSDNKLKPETSVVDRLSPTDEGEFLPKSTQTPILDEAEKVTTQVDTGINTVPSRISDEESTKPSVYEKATEASEAHKQDEATSSYAAGTEATLKPLIPEESTDSGEEKVTEPPSTGEQSTIASDLSDKEISDKKPDSDKESEDEPKTTETSVIKEQDAEIPTKLYPDSITEHPISKEPTATEAALSELPPVIEEDTSSSAEVEKESTEPSILTTVIGNEDYVTPSGEHTSTSRTPLEEAPESPVPTITDKQDVTEPALINEQNTVLIDKEEEHTSESAPAATDVPKLDSEVTPSGQVENTEDFALEKTTPKSETRVPDMPDTEQKEHPKTTSSTIIEEEQATTEAAFKKEGEVTEPAEPFTFKDTKEPSLIDDDNKDNMTPGYEATSQPEQHEPKLTTESIMVQEETKKPIAQDEEIQQPKSTQSPQEMESATTESFMELSTFAHVEDKEPVTNVVLETEHVSTTSAPDKIEPTEITTVNPEDNEIDEIPSPGRIPGEGDCLLEGVTYKNDSIVPNSNKCHTGCRCVSSIIKCDPILCSPPPEYMDNCQPVYDTPESCCPTFVCDHGKETIPPQSHSQMSGTESPTPSSPIECNGDQCDSVDKIPPSELPSETPDRVGGSDCVSNGCTSGEQTPISEQPVYPVDCVDDKCSLPSEACADGKCQPSPPSPEEHPAAIPCENESCDSKPITTPAHDIPQGCVNEEECKQVQSPPLTVPTCEGDACKTPAHDIPQGCVNEEECKQVQSPPLTVPTCEGDACKTPAHDIPQGCVNEEECKQVQSPPLTVPTCEGDACTTPAHDIPQGCANEEECKQVQSPPLTVPTCKGDACTSNQEQCNDGECKVAATTEQEICSGKTDCQLPISDKEQSVTKGPEELKPEIVVPETDMSTKSPGIDVDTDVISEQPAFAPEDKLDQPESVPEKEQESPEAVIPPADDVTPTKMTDVLVPIETGDKATEPTLSITQESETQKPEIHTIDEETTPALETVAEYEPEVKVTEPQEPVTDIAMETSETPLQTTTKIIDEERVPVDAEATSSASPDLGETGVPVVTQEKETESPLSLVTKADQMEITTIQTPFMDDTRRTTVSAMPAPTITDKDIKPEQEATVFDKKEPVSVPDSEQKEPESPSSMTTEAPHAVILEENVTSEPEREIEKTTKAFEQSVTEEYEFSTEEPKPSEDELKQPDKEVEIPKQPEQDIQTTEPEYIPADDKHRITLPQETQTAVMEEKVTEIPTPEEKETEVPTEEKGTELPIIEEEPTDTSILDEKETKIPDVDKKIAETPDAVEKETSDVEEKETESPTKGQPTEVSDAGEKVTSVTEKNTETTVLEDKEISITEEMSTVSAISEEKVTKSPSADDIEPDTIGSEEIGSEAPQTERIETEHSQKESTETPDITRRTEVQPEVSEAEKTTTPSLLLEKETIPPGSEEKASEIPVSEEKVTEPSISEEKMTEPAVEEPLIQDEKTKVPILAEKATEVPEIEEKATEAPALEEKETEEKATEAPIEVEKATVSPSVDEKISEPPAVDEKATESPKLEETATESSVIEDKATESPAVDEKATKPPAADDKATESPAGDEKGTEPLAADDKATETSLEEEKGTESPATDDKATEAPLEEEKGTESPATDDNATTSPAEEEKGTVSPAEEEKGTESPALEEEATKLPVTEEKEPEAPEVDEKATEPPAVKEEATESPATEDKETESPAADEKVTASPAVDQQATESPATEEKATEFPATEEKATESSATEEKVTESPATEEKATESPATEEKVTESPATEEKATESPALEEKATESPAAEEKATGSPATEEKETESSAIEEATESPAVEEKTTESSTMEEKATESPAIDKKATESLAEEEKATESPATEEKETEKPTIETEIPAIEEKVTEAPILDENATNVPTTQEKETLIPVLMDRETETPVTEQKATVVPEQATEASATETAEEQAIPTKESVPVVTTLEDKSTEAPVLDQETKTPATEENAPEISELEEKATEAPSEEKVTEAGAIEETASEEPIYEEKSTEAPVLVEKEATTGENVAIQTPAMDDGRRTTIGEQPTETPVTEEKTTEVLAPEKTTSTPVLSVEEMKPTEAPVSEEKVTELIAEDFTTDDLEKKTTPSPISEEKATELFATQSPISEEKTTEFHDLSEMSTGISKSDDKATEAPETTAEDKVPITSDGITDVKPTEMVKQPASPIAEEGTEAPEITSEEIATKTPEIDTEVSKEDKVTEASVEEATDHPAKKSTELPETVPEEATEVFDKATEEKITEIPDLATQAVTEISDITHTRVPESQVTQTETSLSVEIATTEPENQSPVATEEGIKDVDMPVTKVPVIPPAETQTNLPSEQTPEFDNGQRTTVSEKQPQSFVTEESVPEHGEEKVTTPKSEEHSETTPYLVELEEHPHKEDEELSTGMNLIPTEESTTIRSEDQESDTEHDKTTEKSSIDESQTDALPVATEIPDHTQEITTHKAEIRPTESPEQEIPEEASKPAVLEEATSQAPSDSTLVDKYGPEAEEGKEPTTPKQTQEDEVTPGIETEKPADLPAQQPEEVPMEPEKEVTVKPQEAPLETTAPEEEFIPVTTKVTTSKAEEEVTTPTTLLDKFTKQEEPSSEASTPAPEVSKPTELQPTDEIPSPEDDGHFPAPGYGQDDYMEEDQPFGPGTCRYGGKVYVSAQQIPRDDPCDFCFCFRSDIICLQQSCPPPIHGCHEEPIQGFCCPRYECPVSMATTLNITTTTTTTTTTLPPHFLPHAYKGQAQRRGCQIKGHTYKVGEVVRASSGPCLHCTCGGDGQMKCDPKACTPEPMLRQMIAAAVSAKRRR